MSRGLTLWRAVLVGLQVLAGAGAAMNMVVSEQVWGLFVVLVGAAQAATVAYMHGLFTPTPVGPTGVDLMPPTTATGGQP